MRPRTSQQGHTTKKKVMSTLAVSNVGVKWGPPKSPLVGKGKCPHKRPRRGRNRRCKRCGHYTRDQAVYGGVRSGLVRRWNTRKRDSRIRNLYHVRGQSKSAIARMIGVCPSTVVNVLRRRPFRKLPKSEQYSSQMVATNIIRQYIPPPWARVAVAKLLLWVDRCKASEVDRRKAAIRKRQTNGLRRELARYGRRVRSDDGPEQWQRIRAASRQWLDNLAAAGIDPLPVLVRFTRHARRC